MHAAVAGARQLRGSTRQPGAAQILNAGDQPRVEDLQRALDEQLLHEWIANLDTGAFSGGFAFCAPTVRVDRLSVGVVVEGLGCGQTDATGALWAGRGAIQDHLVAGASGLGEV